MFTPEQESRLKNMMLNFPFRIVFIAIKDGEEDIVDAVPTRHKPKRLAREGWRVYIIK